MIQLCITRCMLYHMDTSHVHRKSTSAIENFRKPASRVLALGIVLMAVFTVPKQFDTIAGQIMEMLGFCLLIVAAIGRVWCAVYISGRKDQTLCQEGPYHLCRNPLYFFSFLGVLGFGLSLQSGLIALICFVTYLLLYRFIIRSEESRLCHIFGQPYDDYMASTPRFFPRFVKLDSPKSYVVNPRVIERSLREIVWFLVLIVLIEVLEILHSHGLLVLHQLPL